MKKKTVMISQPRYLPCLSYLRRIAQADLLIILDTAQRTPRQFENRNKMLMPDGTPKWLTIPVKSSSRSTIANSENHKGWSKEHKNRIMEWYRGKEQSGFATAIGYYDEMEPVEEDYCMSLTSGLRYAMRRYGITTKLAFASDLTECQCPKGIDGLAKLLKAVKATHYISGPACLEYGFDQQYAESIGVELIVDNWRPRYYGNEKDWLPFLHFEFKVGKRIVNELLDLTAGMPGYQQEQEEKPEGK